MTDPKGALIGIFLTMLYAPVEPNCLASLNSLQVKYKFLNANNVKNPLAQVG
jgi:hypothetical protein